MLKKLGLAVALILTLSIPATAQGPQRVAIGDWPEMCGPSRDGVSLETGLNDVFAAVWGSPLVADGKVYLGDEDGDVVIMAHSKEPQVLAEMNMGSAVYGTIVPAHGTLFLNNRSQLFAIAAE